MHSGTSVEDKGRGSCDDCRVGKRLDAPVEGHVRFSIECDVCMILKQVTTGECDIVSN